MRLLVDEHGVPWDEAWDITRRTFAYTNHTLLPEALERWPVEVFGAVAPRHLELVREIDRRFLDTVRAAFPGDEERARRMAIVSGEHGGEVRMAHLATVGSHAVNGVAKLHGELLASTVLADFHALWPERIRSVTNGVTPRRFLLQINPPLARLLSEALGDSWVRDLERLRALEPLAEDAAFRAAWRAVKLAAKRRLAAEIARRVGVVVDPESLFDVQVKRIHEYKRQHLAALHVLALGRRLAAGGDAPPRTLVFAGKAAPGYRMAKRIVRLIHAVAERVNSEPAMRDRLRVVFLPDFNVKHAQPIYPAADLSEQLSTAGMEASGTGNMKMTLNGALTIGTLDGANVEIRGAVGVENFFRFGLTAAEVAGRRAAGYDPRAVLAADPELAALVDLVGSGELAGGDPAPLAPLADDLRERDPFFVLADFRAYAECQLEVERRFLDADWWTRASILNVARAGAFSSDRAIADYCREIWRVDPFPVPL
jgi:starch phosphorylase